MSLPRIRALIFVWCVCALPAHAQRGFGNFGSFDNARFLRYPFDKWAAENAKPQIRWNVRIDPPRLSPHQRMVAGLHISVDGDEIRRHQNTGPIIMFVRIEDSAGHRYQTGGQRPIALLHRGAQFLDLDYDVSAFLLPGDYFVSLAVCDGRTLEHSFVRRRLHVSAINADPLPDAWNGLPPVEFLPLNGIPDAWYIPQLRSRIRLPIETQRPVRVELLVNTTPSELGSLISFRRNMELVVPSLKVLMGIAPSNGSAGLSIIDLNRRAMSDAQADLLAADWPQFRSSFAELSPVTVDAKTLAGQRGMLDYFAREATRLLGPTDQPDGVAHALIVLSAPVYFTRQDKPPPPPEVPSDPRRRVFYISYSPIAAVVLPGTLPAGRSGAATVDSAPEAGSTIRRPLYIFTDDLEHVLKPMGARVFRVSKPEEFRKALAAILDEIGKMPAGR